MSAIIVDEVDADQELVYVAEHYVVTCVYSVKQS